MTAMLTAPDTAARIESRWSFRRHHLLRVAGLPIETVHGLRSPDALTWALELTEAEAAVRTAADLLGDLLHTLIGDNEDGQARRALLALRRQVFRLKVPADADAAAALLPDTDALLVLDRYLRAASRLAQATTDGAAVVTAELERSRGGLRTLVSDETFLSGLLLASPTLADQLPAFAAATGTPDKRLRKVERSVLSYLYRTACKTSPFSTFTPIAFGEFSSGASTELPETWFSHVQLNVVAVARLSELIVADPARRADLPVTVTAGWAREADRIRYVRRTVNNGDTGAAVTFDSAADRLFFLRNSGILDRLITFSTENDRPLRYGDLVTWLADAERADPADSHRYLSDLLDLGLISIPVLGTHAHTRDPLRRLQQVLRDLSVGWAAELADRLDEPIALIDRLGTARPAERRELLVRLRTSIGEIGVTLGGTEDIVPSTILYEDVVGTGAPVGTDLDVWQDVIGDDLQRLESVQSAFDLTVAARLTFVGYFRTRFGVGGRCDDLVALVHDFHEDFYEQYQSFAARRRAFDENGTYQAEENWLRLPAITALDQARTAWVAGIIRELDKADGAEELRLPAALFDQIAGLLPEVGGPVEVKSHFVQLSTDPADPVAVVNRSYGGLFFPFSRFTHGLDRADTGAGPEFSGLLRATAAATEGTDVIFAEVTGGTATTNLNLHSPMTRYQIVCPGEQSTAPAESQIPLSDLYLEHDADQDRLVLRSRRLQVEVVPAYLGYLVPMALPEVSRTLLLLSSSAMAPIDVFGGVPFPTAVDGVSSRPRVRLGNVVLSRRSWSAPVESLPLREPADSEAQAFLRWHRWRIRHGLPDQVFATVYGDTADRSNLVAKPQYVDFTSALSLIALEGLIRSPQGKVVLREMLPAEPGLHAGSAGGRHIAELAVETVHRRADRRAAPADRRTS